MASSNRSQCTKQPLNGPNIQNGNCGGDKKLDLQGGVGSFCRPYRRLFSHPYSSKIAKPTSVSCRRAFLPVQSTTLRHCDGSNRIHSCSQGSKANASKHGYTHPPVFRRLAAASSNTADLHGAVKTTCPIRAGTRLGNQLKIGVNTNSKIRFPGLQVRLGQGRGLTHRKKWLILKSAIEGLNNSITTTPRILMSFIGVLASLEKTVPMGRLHMRPFQWYLKTHWKYPQSLDKVIPCSEILKKHLIWWKNPKNVLTSHNSQWLCQSTETCRGTQSPSVYRCFGQGLGCTFGRPDSQWTVVGHRSKFAYKYSGAKGSVSSNKVFSNSSFEQEGLGGLRQFNSGGLPQQTGGDPFTRNVSHDMASHGFLCQLTCQSADIMSSLCGVGVRVRVNNFFSKTTRPRDVLFFLKDTLSIEDEKLFKACKSVCSSVC